MRDWLTTVALAAAALLAFYTLFLNQGGRKETPVGRPVTIEGGPNGYLGMVRWLRSQKIEPLSLRDRFTTLPRLQDSPKSGNLLISTAPHVYPLRNSEFAPLRRWVEAGNTLLVVAGLSDTPEWAAPGLVDAAVIDNLGRITGLDFVATTSAGTEADTGGDDGAAADKEEGAAEEDETEPSASDPQSAATDETDSTATDDSEDDDSKPNVVRSAVTDVLSNQPLLKPVELELVPVEAHELLAGVERVRAVSEYPSSSWLAVPGSTPLALELATSPQADAPVLWLARAGRGQIIVSGFGSIFTNKVLGRDDNAQLLANIVQWSLQGSGRVIIDDAHQGTVAFYDPQAFFEDPRLHRTLWCVFGLWLVFVLGPQRMRAATRPWSPADLTAFVRATGGFMARVIKPAAAARRMFELFFGEVHQRTGMPVTQSPPWAWLEAHAGVAAADWQALRDLHRAAQANRRVDLQRLHNLLTQVRGSWLRH